MSPPIGLFAWFLLACCCRDGNAKSMQEVAPCSASDDACANIQSQKQCKASRAMFQRQVSFANERYQLSTNTIQSSRSAAFARRAHRTSALRRAGAAASRAAVLRHSIKRFEEHRRAIVKSLQRVQASQEPSTKELKEMMTRMINHHSGSEEGTVASLHEAEEDYGGMMMHVMDLGGLMNATEKEVGGLQENLKNLEDKQNVADEKLQKALAKCKNGKVEKMRFRDELQSELDLLRKVASSTLRRQPNDASKPKQTVKSMSSNGYSTTTTTGPVMPEPELLVQLPRAGVTADVSSVLKAAGLVDACLMGRSPSSVKVGETRKAKQPGKGCSAQGSNVEVEVGGQRGTFQLNFDLLDGNFSGRLCSDINAGFSGMVWIECQNGNLVPDASVCAQSAGTQSSDTCQGVRRQLESTYATVYKNVARLLAEHSALLNSSACEDAAYVAHSDEAGDAQTMSVDISKRLVDRTTSLMDLRKKLDAAKSASEELRQQVKDLTHEAESLPKTLKSLGVVREALETLEKCPNGDTLSFSVPVWAGAWCEFTQKSNASDAQTDNEMLEACGSCFVDSPHAVRVAEVGELQVKSVQGMPNYNTAEYPVLGACPDCEGAPDDATGLTNAEGRSRICWDPVSNFDLAEQRDDCSKGRRSILCVFQQEEEVPFTTMPMLVTTTTTTGISEEEVLGSTTTTGAVGAEEDDEEEEGQDSEATTTTTTILSRSSSSKKKPVSGGLSVTKVVKLIKSACQCHLKINYHNHSEQTMTCEQDGKPIDSCGDFVKGKPVNTTFMELDDYTDEYQHHGCHCNRTFDTGSGHYESSCLLEKLPVDSCVKYGVLNMTNMSSASKTACLCVIEADVSTGEMVKTCEMDGKVVKNCADFKRIRSHKEVVRESECQCITVTDEKGRERQDCLLDGAKVDNCDRLLKDT